MTILEPHPLVTPIARPGLTVHSTSAKLERDFASKEHEMPASRKHPAQMPNTKPQPNDLVSLPQTLLEFQTASYHEAMRWDDASFHLWLQLRHAKIMRETGGIPTGYADKLFASLPSHEHKNIHAKEEMNPDNGFNNLDDHSTAPARTTRRPRISSLLNWHIPSHVRAAIKAYADFHCTIIDPDPSSTDPHRGERIIRINPPQIASSNPLSSSNYDSPTAQYGTPIGFRRGRAFGKIPLPPERYWEATRACNGIENPVQRWWMKRRLERMRKLPLVDVKYCYYWHRREEKVIQWRTYKGFSAKEVGDIAVWVREQESLRDENVVRGEA
ncbi:hypothetical protein FKW77_010521 [Venturia effusa]|uniref:Uncharacterized protein n=1 Tax=Venturia effusa TaxID=50376 RepID=A0A517L2F8_9PEZI|nr:hypothetical protein FKW77_010521 [Venturia effusa]